MARLKTINNNNDFVQGLMLSGQVNGFSRVNYMNGGESSNLVVIPATEKGYFLGEAPAWDVLNPKWWESKKVPMWKKGLVIGLSAVAADQLLNRGAITNKLVGKPARKKKAR